MKLLVTGGEGQVGHAIKKLAHPSCEIIALSHEQFDICDVSQAKRILQTLQPDILINTAALTAVDQAEKEKEKAFAINAKSPEALAILCQQLNIPLIHLSTDYVFDGNQNTPYLETDNPHPINIYGETKLKGEQAIQKNLNRHIILRLSGIFSEHGHNFVKTMVKLAQTQETLQIVTDQTLCPTSAHDIAKTIVTIAKRIDDHSFSQWGIYHYCSNEPVTWYDFTKDLIQILSEKKQGIHTFIQPITSRELKRDANRPSFSALNSDKICNVFALQTPSWHLALHQTINELLQTKEKA